jgi:phage host-nuclease inhibitor protein Gam
MKTESLTEAIDLMGQIRQLAIQKARLSSERDKKIKAIDDHYAPLMVNIDEQLESLADQVRAWAESHPEAFDNTKSVECLHGKFGWRLGNWKVSPIRPRTWAKVLENLKKMLPQFIRIKEEVDREALILKRAEIDPATAIRVGIQFKQENRFFVEPNLTEPSP